MKTPVCQISPIQRDLEETIRVELQQGTPRYPLSPSRISNCQRQLSYDLINFHNPYTIPKVENSLTKLMMFDNGHRAEERIFDWVSKVPSLEVVKDKQRFELVKFGEQPITCELDRIVYDKKRDKKFVADAKTTNTRSFKEIYESLVPRDSAYLQVQSYLAAPLIQEQGIKDGLLYYENKDDHRFLLLEFPFDPEAARLGIERLFKVYQSGTTPLPREFVFGDDWHCDSKYCAYHDYCYSSLKTGKIVIEKQDLLLDEYLASPKGRGMEAIKCLLAYGDAHEYHYGQTIFKLNELKTTLSLEVQIG